MELSKYVPLFLLPFALNEFLNSFCVLMHYYSYLIAFVSYWKLASFALFPWRNSFSCDPSFHNYKIYLGISKSENSTFGPVLVPFSRQFFLFGALSMLHNFYLSHMSNRTNFLKTIIVFFKSKFNNQFVRVHLLSLIFKITLKCNLILNNRSYLESFSHDHPYSMNLVHDHLDLLKWTNYTIEIHTLSSRTNDEFLDAHISMLYFQV